MENAVKLPSSANAIHAMPNAVSDKYQFFSTKDLVTKIEAMGYVLSSAQQAFARKEKQGYQRHVLRFRLPQSIDNQQAFALKQEFPEIVIVNSHDGSSSMRIIAGLFRLVCANGLISGRALDEIRIRHVKRIGVNPDEQLQEVLRVVAEKAKALAAVAERWKQVSVTESGVKELLTATLEARTKGTAYEGKPLKVDSDMLLRAYRPEDIENNLWTVFNVLQEKAIKSAFFAQTIDGETVRLNAPKALDRQVGINQYLWNAAEKLAA